MPRKPPTHQPPRPRTPEVRGNSTQRGYGSRWRRLRASHLAVLPSCEHCLQEGVARPATVVDHVTPHRGDQGLLWDAGNLQSLCERCHNRKTAGGQ